MLSLRRLVPALLPISRSAFGAISGKKYNTRLDVNPYAYIHLSDHLLGAYNCELISLLLKENLSTLTDRHLALAITQIRRHDMELDDHFYNVIVPIVKEYYKQLDWEANGAMGDILRDFAMLQVQDDSAFEVFEEKLIKEKMFRYLTLDQMADIYLGLNASQRHSPLLELFDGEFIKHRKGVQLDGSLMDRVHRAMVGAGKDSDTVIELLEEGLQAKQIQ